MLDYLVAGSVIGALARVAQRRRQARSLWLTVALGLVAAFCAATIADYYGIDGIFDAYAVGLALTVMITALMVAIASHVARRPPSG